MGEKFYIHSKCCGEHWELTYQDGVYGLECLKCGKLAGPLKIQGPIIPDGECKCAICESKKVVH